MTVSRGALAIAGMAATCWSASAAELTTTLSTKNTTIVNVRGALADGDAARFQNILRVSFAAGKPVSAVRLNSPGGSLLEGARLAAVIHKVRIETSVTAGATCAGACFFPFIAGSQKYASATASFAVPGAKSEHQPSGKTVECDRNCPPAALVQSEKPPIIQLVQRLGLLDAIVSRMMTTSEDSTFQLTLDDLRAMGVMTTGRPPRPKPPPPKPAPAM
jgi:hypothetical protein